MAEFRPITHDPALTAPALDRIARDLENLRQEILAAEEDVSELIATVHPDNRRSARNLVHYVALRRRDVRPLQLRLARTGLSSLGRSESHVLATIERVLGLIALARGSQGPASAQPPVGFCQGERLLAAHTRRLLGPPRPHRLVRIAVTLPSEAADDPGFVRDLMLAGMDCARINCARDDAAVWSKMADNIRAARRSLNRDCRILVDLRGPKLRTGPIAGGARRLLLSAGDRLELIRDSGITPPRRGALPRITCTFSQIFDEIRPGQPIWFDDGRIGGIIEQHTEDGVLVRITHAGPEGSKLRPDRGINLPDTSLHLPALSQTDLRDLAHVVDWADAIELSFVQTPDDVLSLLDALDRYDAVDTGVILKIETRSAFANLPRLLLTVMRRRSCGVMIARGDLAVEAGFARMAEMQEEILWIAEAAHVPTIWATQVLDNLAREGTLSRAEMTDAAMSARAEAVLLSKGPFIIDAIRALDDILARMKEHQSKKRSLFRALAMSSSLWPDQHSMRS